jgi:hypothetical protein
VAAPEQVVRAVQAGILASAHMASFEHVGAAAQACRRLGSLSSGRWRSAARDLDALEGDLLTAYTSAAEALSERADELGIPEEALWTVGDAAGTLEMLREAALEQVDDDDARTRKLLDGDVLFGVSFVEDPELPDRGTTLLFGWPDPLNPVTWPWQANWVVGDGQDTASDDEDSDGAEELDLFEAGEMEGDESILGDLAAELGCSRQEARSALRSAAMALTRASLLASVADEEEEEEDDDDDSTN